MIINNARVVTLANAMSDTKALVTCKDELGLATIGTDFIFDFLNPSEYFGGALPSVGASVPNAGIVGVALSAAGSGGTNGTFALGISGGGGSGAAGTFTVAGGVITDVTITAQGSGYTGTPTLSFTASAGLTGASAQAIAATCVNLARDVQPAQSRTKLMGLTPISWSAKPTFNGKGLAFVNGTTVALQLLKSMIPGNRVCEPPLEGFVDVLESVTFNATSFPVANISPYVCTHGGGGIQFNTAGAPSTKENGAALGAAVPTGKVVTVAKLVRFNVGAGTSTITGYVGYDGVTTVVSGIAGKATASYTSNSAGQVALVGGGSGAAGSAWNGTIHRVQREYVGLSGMLDADVLAYVGQIVAAHGRWA